MEFGVWEEGYYILMNKINEIKRGKVALEGRKEKGGGRSAGRGMCI